MNNINIANEDFQAICSITSALVNFQEKFDIIKFSSNVIMYDNDLDEENKKWRAALILQQSSELEEEVQAMLRCLSAFIEANKPEE